eukprot:jgi/Mesvir1/22681/Mv14104-RA.1
MSASGDEEQVDASEEQQDAAFDAEGERDRSASDQQDDQPGGDDGDGDDEGDGNAGDDHDPGSNVGSDLDETNEARSDSEAGGGSGRHGEAGEGAPASDDEDYEQERSGGDKGDVQDDGSDDERRSGEDQDGANADNSEGDDDYNVKEKQPIQTKLKFLKKKVDKPKEKAGKEDGKEKKKKKRKQKDRSEDDGDEEGEVKRKRKSRLSKKGKEGDTKSKPRKSRAQPSGKPEKKQSMFAKINSEDDEEGEARDEDRAFIDDAGARRDTSDSESGGEREGEERRRSQPPLAPEAVEALAFFERKKRKVEVSREDMEAEAEMLLQRMDMAVEDDVEANRRGEPALKKVMLLPEAVEMLQKKTYKEAFLSHDVLKVLRNWLEPMEDGSLPNIQIRAAILRILKDMNLDTLEERHKHAIRESGIGKVVMFLSRCDQETALNKKVARSIIEDWSRPIIGASTRYEDAAPEEETEERRSKKQVVRKAPEARSSGGPSDAADTGKGVDSELDAQGQLMSRKEAARLHARIPEMSRMDFKVRPRSMVEEKERKMSDKHAKMAKTIQKLRAPKKIERAIKPSIEGRGLVKTR